MKKIIALVLATIMIVGCVFSLASCSGGTYDGLVVLKTDDLFDIEEYGVAFRKNSDLAKRLDEMFAEVFKDGTAKTLATKYGCESGLVETFEKGKSTATSTSDYDYIKNKGKLVIGVTVFEGFDTQDENGEWVGFDADMAKKFAEKLGVTAEFKEIEWDNKLVELESKAIDCIWNGMTVTDAILNACEVSGSYMINGQVVVIKKGAFKSVDELKNKTVAVEGGSAGYSQATEKLKDSKIKEVSAQTDALLEVKAGTSDACVIDYLLAKTLLKAD